MNPLLLSGGKDLDYIFYGSINIPIIYYIAAALIFLFYAVVFSKKNFPIMRGLFFAYFFLVLSSTVFAREKQPDYDYSLKLFWSYEAIYYGREDLIIENIFNVIMFMPIGFLLQFFKELKILFVVCAGIVLSFTIELSQLVFMKGFFECDDIFHNTLGCVIGCLMYRLLQFGARHLKK